VSSETRLLPGGEVQPLTRRAARAAERKRRGPVVAVLLLIREVVVVVLVALGLSLLVKTFLVQAFFIPSPSMESTLIRGDRVVVSKLTPGVFDLKRGDILVFSDPGGWLTPTARESQGRVRDGFHNALTFIGLLPADSEEHLIKRLIGLPGDKVVCCDAGRHVTVNGVPIDEPYLFPGDAASKDTFSVTVPPGRLWMMGDHRSVSEDSRYHPDLDGGMVPIADVVGRAFSTVWPLDRAKLLRNPSSTFAEVPRP
jgi:signal peptidase I